MARAPGLLGKHMLAPDLFGPSIDIDLTAAALDSRISFARASAKTYFDATGTMQSAPNDTWPVEYDPTSHAVLGRSVWQQSTNLITNSQAGIAAAGAGATSVGTSTDITAPYPSATVIKHVRGTSSDSNVATVTGASMSTGTSYVMSAYVYIPSSFTGTQVYVRMEKSSTTFSSVVYADLTKIGVWQRVSSVVTTTEAGTGTGVLRVTGNSGDTVYSTMPQIEALPAPTPYIPTSGSTVTRAADVAKLNTGPWSNAYTTGTVYVEYYIDNRSTGVNSSYVISVNGPTNGRYSIRSDFSGSPLAVFVTLDPASSVIALNGMTNTVYGAKNIVCFSWSERNLYFAMNNTSSQSVGYFSIGAINEIVIGNYLSSIPTNAVNGYISRFRYYNRQVSNEIAKKMGYG